MHAQVYGYCMFKDGKQAKVAYPTQDMAEDVAGRSFHNGRFVQRLRQAAAAQHSITVRQGIATALLNGQRLLKLCVLLPCAGFSQLPACMLFVQTHHSTCVSCKDVIYTQLYWSAHAHAHSCAHISLGLHACVHAYCPTGRRVCKNWSLLAAYVKPSSFATQPYYLLHIAYQSGVSLHCIGLLCVMPCGFLSSTHVTEAHTHSYFRRHVCI